MFLLSYGAFLGAWVQVFISFFILVKMVLVFKIGKLNGRPQYTKLGNENMFLSYTNATNYPTPWTMWAGPTMKPGSHLGNIKIGPANTACPEGAKVFFLKKVPVTCVVDTVLFLELLLCC